MVVINTKINKNLKISIIIPTFNRPNNLKRVLDSLENQTYNNFEVVIIEGDSIDITKKVIDRRELNIVCFRQKGEGLVNAVNEGWRSSTGDIIIRTDDDILSDREWLQGIIDGFNKSKLIGGVTGPTIVPDEIKDSRDLFYFQDKMRHSNIFWRLLGKVYYDYLFEGNPSAIGKFFRSGAFSVGSNFKDCLKLKGVIEVDHHEACNLAVRRDLLESIGGFDEIYTGVGDYNESDVSFKIRKLGYKILFNPKAKIFHLTSRDGVYKKRVNSYCRMLNFIIFYFRHIKPNNLDKFLRFSSYLFFLNGYYTYRFFTTWNFGYLQSIPATFIGFFQNVFKRN